MSETNNSKQQNHIDILSGEYEGTPMRINLPPDLEQIVIDMQQALYDSDFLKKGLIPKETPYHRNPGKKWINKKFVLVYMLYLVQHWLVHAVDHQKEINTKLREEIQNQ